MSQQSQTLRVVERLPSVAEYQGLRAAVGWLSLSAEVAHQGLEGSLYSVCAVLGDTVAGCGRIVGDGAVYFYLQDIAVFPAYQGQGVGSRIMDALMRWLEQNAPENSFVGLMAATGAASFYHRYGFRERAAEQPGMYKRMTG